MNRRAAEAFRLLGIPPNSDRSAIVHAYRRLARTVHPDVSVAANAAERFANLADAYRIVTSELTPRSMVVEVEQIPVRQRGARPAQAAPIVAGPVRIAASPPRPLGERRG